MRGVRTYFAAVLLFLTATGLHGQTFGEITGAVTDSSGAVILGVAVSVTNTATNQARQAQTSETGSYTLPFLVPGVYNVEVRQAGFKSATRRGVEVQVGVVARIDFVLEVGAVTESIEVAGGAPLLETTSTAVGTVIENKRIIELPLNGRNYLQLVRLTTHVNAEMGSGGAGRQGGERAQQPLSVGGQRLEFNHFTLDGVENTDVNYNTYAIRPSIEALQEFKVQSGIYSAEFGRQTSQINVTTRPGANQFYGSVFEFHRNENLDAKEWSKTGSKNHFVRNQYGFTLGGRLIRDRLFFMSNFEALRDRKALLRTASVATDRMRAGDFTASGRRVFDHLTRTFRVDARGNEEAVSALPYPNQVIPRSRFHPVTQKLLEFYPSPTQPGDSIFRNFERNAARPISWEQFTQRIDWTERPSSQWFGRFSWGDEFVGGTETFPAQVGRVLTKTYQSMLSNTRTLSPSVVNEFRFGYTQTQNDNLLRFGNERDVTAELGVTGFVSPIQAAWGTPGVSLENGLAGFGENRSGPFVNRDHTFQWLDNVSVIRGNHSLKFGAELRRDRFNQLGNQDARGSFIFQSKASFDPASRLNTGHSFADYLVGQSRRTERALGVAVANLRATSMAFYFEDSWKVTPKLTVTLGLRYENTPPYHDKHRGIMNLQVFGLGVGEGPHPQLLPRGTVPTPILTRPGKGDFHEGLDFRFADFIPIQAGDEFMGRALIARDNNDFAPRLGVAWSPNTRWTFRTGVGIFYSQDTGNPRFDISRNLAGRGRFEADEERPNADASDPFRFQREAFPCRGFSGPCQGPPQVLANIFDRRTPYIAQWMFNVQHLMQNDTAVELSYQGSAGVKLERMYDLNEAVQKTSVDDRRTIAQRTPFPEFGRVQEVGNDAHSSYHSAGIKVHRRLASGLTYLTGFTWSKSIDNGSAIRINSGDRLKPPNAYNLRAERGLSQFHQGRRFIASLLYEVPFPGRTGVANRLLGGWQLGSILTFADGNPVNVGQIGDTNNIGNNGNYPDATGISPIPKDRSPDRFWNIAAFDRVNRELSVRFGNAGRNVLITPGVAQWDFSMLKDFQVREGHRVQFRFEAFNFSNHPNFNDPGSDTRNAATFGRITTAKTMRELQFGLKYLF